MSAHLAAPEPRTLNPEPAPEPSRKLPPTARDFEIYEALHIAGCSTRSQADKHQISQIRVRQIVRRVVEWLGEVLPPQAKVAREQETHLARQIAADRFQHQYEQMTTFWNMTQESKYAGIRLRIITAQARLGAVGGRLDGLAADAIEGIPVPVWQPPADVVGQTFLSAAESDPSTKPQVVRRSPDPAQVVRGSPDPAPTQVVRGSPDPAPTNPIPNPQSQIPNPIDPGEAELLNVLRYIWPPTERVRLAVELQQALEVLSPEDREAIRAKEAQHLPAEQLALEAAVRAGHISGEDAYGIDPASYSPTPPNEDCSTKIESPVAAPGSPAENLATSSSYGNTTETESDQIAPSQPLLTSRPPQPVTALTITPAQPGATISTPPNTRHMVPCPLSPVPCPLTPDA